MAQPRMAGRGSDVLHLASLGTRRVGLGQVDSLIVLLVLLRLSGAPSGLAPVAGVVLGMLLLPFSAERPLMLTYLCLAALLVYLETLDWRKNWWCGLWAGPLFAVWGNFHAGSVLGVAVVVTAWAQAEVARLVQAEREQPPSPRLAILRVAALVAIASCAVNPWTWRLFLYPLQASANPFTQNFISEWLPPNTRSPYVRYLFGGWILTALGIPAYVGVAARRLDILLVLLGLGMATSSVRHIPVATILATPAVGRALSAAAHAWAAWRVAQQVSRPTSGGCEKDALPVRRVVLDWLIAGVAVVALLAYAVPFAGTSRSSVLYPTQPRGEARERIHYPAAAVQYLREH